MSTSDSGGGWLTAGYAGLAGFFVLERVLRAPGGASALRASDDDQGTTRLIITAYAVATDLPWLTRRWRLGRMPRRLAPAGLLVEAGGLGLRAWSMRELGSSYTRTLRTEGAEQPVVQSGPYRWVRHPGYLGSLLTWTGFALTTRSAPTIALVGGLLGFAYGRRIAAEEQLLARELPGYEEYMDDTSRLIPRVW